MQPHDAGIIRGAAIPTGIAGLAGAVLCLILAGTKGAVGAVIATAVVMAFFSISVLAVTYAGRISAMMMMQAALFSYVVKILGMVFLIKLLEGITIWNQKAFAWTVIALTLVWIAGETRAIIKSKMPYVEPAEPSA